MIGLIGGLQLDTSQTTAAGRSGAPDKIREAASQFEALLIAQMLRQIRETGSGGWMGEGEDQSASSLMGLAEEQLAQVLASQGGLGLAALTAGQIAQESVRADSSLLHPPAGPPPPAR